jgi:hypothetical protein
VGGRFKQKRPAAGMKINHRELRPKNPERIELKPDETLR